MDQLQQHDWQEAVFTLYSTDGEHLSQPEFVRLVQVEYDHGFGKEQLPQKEWVATSEGLRKWASFWCELCIKDDGFCIKDGDLCFSKR